MSQLRTSILAEQQIIASKTRFGLFSQPPPLAIGDDSLFKQKQYPRGQNGKPVTKPRNLLGGTNRTGMGKKGYFGVPDSIYQGDKYQDKFKIQIQYQKKMHSKSAFHQTQFKPASGPRTLAKSSYQYKEQKTLQQRKIRLNENGRVCTQPRNVTTNSMIKVQGQLMKNPEHISDPFDRKHQQYKKDKQTWKSKLPESAWRLASNSIGAFMKDQITYGLDGKSKQLISLRKQARKLLMKTVAHDSPFVPAIKTTKNALNKYPAAMSAQSMESLRPRAKTQKAQQERWVPNNGLSKSKPTPSISLNRKNIHNGRHK